MLHLYHAEPVANSHLMVRKVAQRLDKNELDKVLERIPLKEQRDKWATIAGESFTESQLASRP